jgi:hypothetical protein
MTHDWTSMKARLHDVSITGQNNDDIRTVARSLFRGLRARGISTCAGWRGSSCSPWNIVPRRARAHRHHRCGSLRLSAATSRPSHAGRHLHVGRARCGRPRGERLAAARRDGQEADDRGRLADRPQLGDPRSSSPTGSPRPSGRGAPRRGAESGRSGRRSDSADAQAVQSRTTLPDWPLRMISKASW